MHAEYLAEVISTQDIDQGASIPTFIIICWVCTEYSLTHARRVYYLNHTISCPFLSVIWGNGVLVYMYETLSKTIKTHKEKNKTWKTCQNQLSSLWILMDHHFWVLLIFLIFVLFRLSETGQIWGFRGYPGERMEGMAWNFACWCILTTFSIGEFWVMVCWLL